MSSSSFPLGVLGELGNNKRLVVAGLIMFAYTSCVTYLFTQNPTRFQFFVYVSVPTMSILIAPFLVTKLLIERIYSRPAMEAYLRTISDASGDSVETLEVDLSSETMDDLPPEFSDADSVKILDEELFRSVDGSEYDIIDADARGIVAIGVSSLAVMLTAPYLGILLDGALPSLVGLAVGLVALGIVLQQHRDMLDLIEYSEYDINNEN